MAQVKESKSHKFITPIKFVESKLTHIRLIYMS